jgi:hypothetical protein
MLPARSHPRRHPLSPDRPAVLTSRFILEVVMASHRLLTVASLIALLTAVACESAPGTSGPEGWGNIGGNTGGSDNIGGNTGGSGNIGGAGGSTPPECPPDCGPGLVCCNGTCVNLGNDVDNCGACGVACAGPTPYCDGTQCQAVPPCGPETTCDDGGTCCGPSCCPVGQLCCIVPPSEGVACFLPVDGTCPEGLPVQPVSH